MFKPRFLLSCLFFTAIANSYACDSSNRFQCYDNNVTLNYGYGVEENTARFSEIGVGGEALFDNNIWLNGAMDGLFTYSNSNNNQGLQQTFNNASGSSFTLRGGYAFNVDSNYNFIPYLGFNYTNTLVAYNYDSINQFVIENPSFNTSIGVISEYNIIDNKLKFRLDSGLTYSFHKAVAPGSNDDLNSLSHVDYSNYLLNFTPELQYNINNRLTMSVFSTLGFTFGGNASLPEVYYPDIATNTNQVFNNDNTYAIFGLKFGILF